MVNKLTLLGIAVLAIGLLALPQTLALFMGQHNFYDVDIGDPNFVPCEKCHADVASELSQSGDVNVAHKAQDCEGCHLTEAPKKEGLTVSGVPGPTTIHAAAAPYCLDCHSGTGPGVNARSILESPEEVHRPFVIEANKSTNLLLKGGNEACVGCHTHIGMDINWTKATNMSFSAEYRMDPDGRHNWTLSNFTASGTNTTTTHGGG